MNVPSSQATVEGPPEPRAALDTKRDTDKVEGDPIHFPEGGTAAWFAVVGTALVQFCGFGYMASFGVYQDFYTLHYLANKSASEISWIGSIGAFLATTVSLVAGILYDRGYFYHLLIGGSLLESISLFMLSLTKPGQYYEALLAQGIGFGIALGLMYVPSTTVVSHYFRQRRTLAMSLVASGSPLGSITHPIMLNNLFNRNVGFANGVRLSAAFISILLLTSCIITRTRLEPPKHPTSFLAVGRGVIRDVPFCIMCVAMLCFQIGFYFPFFYLQLDSVKHGNPETFSFYSLVFLNSGNLIGRLSAGFIAPRIGVPRMMIISTAGCGILILGMMGLNSVPTVVVLGTMYGYFAGVSIALTPPLMALLTSDLSELGVRMGIGVAINGIGSLIGGPISGALLTPQYRWWRPSLFNGLVVLAGSSLFMMMQIALTRRRECSSAEQAHRGPSSRPEME